MVSQVSKTLEAFHGGTSNIIHTVLIVTAVRFVMIGETPVAPMPETTQELVHCVAGFIKAIHPPKPTRDLVFALVASVLDTFPMVWKGVVLLQLIFLPQEPFHGGLGVVGDESPALDRFGGDGVFLHAVEPCHEHGFRGILFFLASWR